VSLQRLFYGALPQRLLSRFGGRVARLRAGWLTTAFIRWFVRHYGVDLTEAESADASAYPSFQAFFTRSLRDGVRGWPGEAGAVASPVDGAVSAGGPVRDGTLLQAKGVTYSLGRLLDADPDPYDGGQYLTLYLRPHDYHRVHAPLDARLVAARYCPGRLWPVRPWAVESVPGLFAGNERLVLDFETGAGPMALVMVGALMVGSLETVVTGPVRRGRREPSRWNLSEAPRAFARGEEIGRFNFGSTVILAFGRGAAELDASVAEPEREVRLGERIGMIGKTDR